MNKQKIIKELSLIKQHLDELDNWSLQAMDMIYKLENLLLDLEQMELNKFFNNEELYGLCSMRGKLL